MNKITRPFLVTPPVIFKFKETINCTSNCNMEVFPKPIAKCTVAPLSAEPELDEERAQFKKLQQNFASQFESSFPDRMAPKTVVIVPSLTLDSEILQKIDGANYYEERMLCLLMLLRMPRTHVVYVTSMPIDPAIVDYYLHLLPGITAYHAVQRLTLLSCFDASSCSLTEKILARPRLLKRIKDCIQDRFQAHLSCFNVTEAERKLSVALEIPVFGCDPDLQDLGNKSNSRKLFRTCGIPTPTGYEDLYTKEDIADALHQLKMDEPGLRKAVVKINEGFSGDGNAIFSFENAPNGSKLFTWLNDHLLENLHVIAKDLTPEKFMQKFGAAGGVVEVFIEGDRKHSPSVQCRINPLGKIEIISTHDQMLGGESGQVYLGASFPARQEYAPMIAEMGRKIAEELRFYGVLGRFAVDFISVHNGDEWKHYAIEINLRKGGTTHPFLMLEFLTNGIYHADKGMYYAANGQPRFYVCSDNLQSDLYKGLTPHDMIDIAMCSDLLYDGSTQEGVMFHLISALSQYGKLGVVCIGATPEHAEHYYRKIVDVLNREGRR
ncbi:peptide ligase PGM1-related protein [Flavisolibacter nicotianae]|uniref:peptide ligase PGM1-related protein n=1 Tax=Flavisolibacter nicotianae TaxID=2364882 RepID=UPI0019692C94|nr:peptide ligase PGM1-related protein [Flavisolibacter nicotianae]